MNDKNSKTIPQIISASRRTDIPAFYSRWFLQRVREGFVEVVNPFNPRQRSRVSLRPEHTLGIVFWTRHPRPLMPYLAELQGRGYLFYFQWTLNRFPRAFEATGPDPERVVADFHELSARLSPAHLVWRYDPILFSNLTPAPWHLENFADLAARLRGATDTCIISFADFYRKTRRHFAALEPQVKCREPGEEEQRRLVEKLQKIAAANNMELRVCCEDQLLDIPEVKKAHCVDLERFRRLDGDLKMELPLVPSRPQCGCYASKDIGAYDSCLFRCNYCYANANFVRSLQRHALHDWRQKILIPSAKNF